MVELEAQADLTDLQRMDRVLSALQERTGRDAFQSVMFASVRLCESGRARSRPGRTQREVVKNPLFGMSRKKRGMFDLTDAKQNWMAQYRYMVAIDTQAKGRRWWYTHDKNDPKAKVPRWGLANKTWNRLAARVAATKGQTFSAVDYATFGLFQNDNVTVATIRNALSYLEEAYPGIQGAMMEAALKKLEYEAGLRVSKTCATLDKGA